MADTTALSAAPPPSPGPTPRAAVAHAAIDAIDVYSETPHLVAGTADNTITNWFGKDGFDFKDLLDIVNPLQHLPVVGTLYRALTGDTLEPGPRILGGTLFGGIGGFATSLANAVYENETGKDLGDTALAMITGDDARAPTVATAAAASVPAATPAAAAASAHAAGPSLAATAAITPTAPSPLALAGHAKTPGLPLAASAAANEDPVSALLNARAAVPATHSAAATGLPATSYRSSLKMPDGKRVPIQFKHPVTPASSLPAAHTATPTAEKAVVTAMAAHDAPAGATAPRSLQPAASNAAAQGAKKVAAGGVQPDVPVLMREALEKYEVLMKSRTNHSISGEI